MKPPLPAEQEGNKPIASALRLCFRFLVISFLCGLIYVLSMGPAWLAVNRGIISIQTFDTAYKPFGYLANRGYSEDIYQYLKLWYPIYRPAVGGGPRP